MLAGHAIFSTHFCCRQVIASPPPLLPLAYREFHSSAPSFRRRSPPSTAPLPALMLPVVPQSLSPPHAYKVHATAFPLHSSTPARPRSAGGCGSRWDTTPAAGCAGTCTGGERWGRSPQSAGKGRGGGGGGAMPSMWLYRNLYRGWALGPFTSIYRQTKPGGHLIKLAVQEVVW